MPKKKKEPEEPTVRVGRCKDFEIVIQICFKNGGAIMSFLNKAFLMNQERKKIKCPSCGNKNAEVINVKNECCRVLVCSTCGYVTKEDK